MADITQIGTGAGVGGFLGALISHLKHREIKKDIEKRVPLDLCEEKHKTIDKKLDKIDEKLDRLIERRVNFREE